MLKVRPSRFVRLLAAVAVGVAAVATLPAVGAQAATASFNESVRGGYNDTQPLGNATGSVTRTGSASASYSVTLCGQNTYPSSRVVIQGGTASVNHVVYYQDCETFSGTFASSSAFAFVTITVSGSTFYPGNQYTTYTKTATRYI
jgi:hypothetical protein